MKNIFFIIALLMVFLSCNSGSRNAKYNSYNLKLKYNSGQIKQPVELTIVDSTDMKIIKL